jgi:hypothetical protein
MWHRCPRPTGSHALTLGASPLTQSLQEEVERLQADRAAVRATQVLLNLCQSGHMVGT